MSGEHGRSMRPPTHLDCGGNPARAGATPLVAQASLPAGSRGILASCFERGAGMLPEHAALLPPRSAHPKAVSPLRSATAVQILCHRSPHFPLQLLRPTGFEIER